MSKDASFSKRKSERFPKSTQAFLCLFVTLIIHFRGWAPLFVCDVNASVGTDTPDALQRRQLMSTESSPKITVFVSNSDSSNAKKLKIELLQSKLVDTVVQLDARSPTLPKFTLPCCNKVQSRYKDLHSTYPFLAEELMKYCALAQSDGGLVVDGDSPMLMTLEDFLSEGLHYNVGVLNDEYVRQAIHGAFLYLQDGNIAKQMVDFLANIPAEELQATPNLLPTNRLYDMVAADAKVTVLSPGIVGKSWILLQHKCTIHTVQEGTQGSASISSHNVSNSYSLNQNCPESVGFCCRVVDPKTQATMMLSKHLVLPHQVATKRKNIPKPIHYETGHYNEGDLTYISTIAEKVFDKPMQSMDTPNIFDILSAKDCLPDDKRCMNCLKSRMGGNCRSCKSFCQCYCKALCHTPIPEKFISKELTIRPPQYARDPSRLIPKIIHQTWFEDVTPEEYPHQSRLIESFKQSGWRYMFYTDKDIENFLSTHFPPEVRQAYDALLPGSFKADLFRYCVLLIYGGVYADIDILLETNLNFIEPDIGFMVPEDEPGDSVGKHKMCLWNGFIASAPGHPFMAKVIETAVNNARNRFTIVDIDAMFCPKPELSILREVDTLFPTGPCLLGATINKVLGRHGQASFAAGEIDMLEVKKEQLLGKKHKARVALQEKPSQKLPGRTVILHQCKQDMGAHRFSLLEKNLVVAATDLPGANDRGGQKKPKEHYSNTHIADFGIYGLDLLYGDNIKANEELRFHVER